VSKIIAKVNNQAITSKDLNDFCKMLSYRLPNEEANNISLDDENFKKEALDKLIEDKLILDQAKKEKIEVPPDWVEAKFGEIVAAYPSREQFEASLIEKGLNITILKSRIKEQYLVRQVIDKYVRAYIRISPQEINRFYEAQPEKFVSSPMYSLRIARSKNKNDLIELGKIIKEKGIAEAEKNFQGSLNTLESSKEELKEEIAQAIEGIKEGDFIIKKIGDIDYLVYLDKTIPPKNLSFAEARKKIHSFLWMNKFKERYQEWVKSLREKATIIING
jgi:hypothetical protein